jgi:hypothetical protein
VQKVGFLKYKRQIILVKQQGMLVRIKVSVLLLAMLSVCLG